MNFRSFALTAAAAAALGAPLAPAWAATVTFRTDLSGAAEAVPNASPGVGSATVVIDDAVKSMHVMASFSGLMGNVTAAHIHCCTAAAGAGTAGVSTQVPNFIGFPTGVTAGSYDMVFDMTLASSWNPAYVTANGGSTDAAFAALLSGMVGGSAYLNIHTASVPSGEIRGFLAEVPEPASMALALLALGGAALRRRRG